MREGGGGEGGEARKHASELADVACGASQDVEEEGRRGRERVASPLGPMMVPRVEIGASTTTVICATEDRVRREGRGKRGGGGGQSSGQQPSRENAMATRGREGGKRMKLGPSSLPTPSLPLVAQSSKRTILESRALMSLMA